MRQGVKIKSLGLKEGESDGKTKEVYEGIQGEGSDRSAEGSTVAPGAGERVWGSRAADRSMEETTA